MGEKGKARKIEQRKLRQTREIRKKARNKESSKGSRIMQRKTN